MDESVNRLYTNIVSSLSQWGNNLTDSEKAAVRELSEEYISLLNPESNHNKRLAIPLPTGFGKTLSVKEFIKFLINEDIKTGVVICQATLNEIEEVIDSLISDGVPEGYIGVSHKDSRRHNMRCYVPDEEIKHRQFIFITHQRIHRNVNYTTRLFDIFNFNGLKRVTIWDESAITQDYEQVNVNELQGEIALINRMYNPQNENQRNFHVEDLIGFCRNLNDAIETLKVEKVDITIPEPSERLEWKKLPHRVQSRCNSLKKFLTFASSGKMDYVKTSHQEDMMVLLKEKIPDEMDNMIIFDASALHNRLIEYDTTITTRNFTVQRDYSNCNLYVINSPGSHSALQSNPQLRAAQIEAVKWIINDVGKSDEPSLIFTLKNKPYSSMNLPVVIKEKIPNATVLNWGRERGLNKYSNIRTIANIGTLYLPEENIQSMIMAQTRDLDYRPSYSEVESVQRSLQIVSLQQAGTRGVGRRSNNGVAESFDWILIHRNANEVAEKLSNIFAGINIIKPNLPDNISNIINDNHSYTMQMVETFYLLVTDTNVDSISMTRIKKEAEIPFRTDDRVWTDKIKPDFEDIILRDGRWIKEGRSYRLLTQI